MTPRRYTPIDEPPRPPRDRRLGGIIRPKELQPWRQAAHERNNRRVLEPSARGRARLASEILRDFGDPDCPRAVLPAAALFLEARTALGWKRQTAQRRLGFECPTGYQVRQIETGLRTPPRFARLLIMQALRELTQRQRMGGS